MAKNRIIIDTDPGCDDILAMLLAFAAKPEDLEVLLISITYGNIDVENCLRNVVSLFHVIGKEVQWRKSQGKPSGFDALMAHKPVVAVGAKKPLAEQTFLADFFHGADGLGGIHSSHPHLTPSEAWKHLFENKPTEETPSFSPQAAAPSATSSVTPSDVASTASAHNLFTPSTVPAHEMILRTLAENPPDTVTIVAIGPLTNIALAASKDVATLLRARDIVVMGGAIDVPGNITPVAEFNTHADTVAFARVLALTSPTPSSTLPPTMPPDLPHFYPNPLDPAQPSRRLTLTMLPLDITTSHVLSRASFAEATKTHGKSSPLAEWTEAFLEDAWAKTSMHGGLSMHDPLAVWYAFDGQERVSRAATVTSGEPAQAKSSQHNKASAWNLLHDEDVRVETTGQWTRGECVIDRRGRPRKTHQVDVDVELPGDRGGWIDTRKGNRVRRVVASPVSGGQEGNFAAMMLKMIFDL